MKLTYNILCLDDNISSLDESKQYLTAFNDAVGIETKYTDIQVKIGARDDPDEFWESIVGKIENSFLENTFDMILVDLHMGIVSGADVIDTIRNSHTIFRPIIFYSAGEPSSKDKAIEQLSEAAKNAGVLGKSVLITSRDDLYNQAKSIFEEMHTEEHKVNHVRGLLMDSVSEFDASVVELVQNEEFLQLIPAGPARNKIVTEFKSYLKHDFEKAEAIYKQINSMDITAIPNFIRENPKDISTYRKAYLLKSIIKQVDEYKAFADILSEGIDGFLQNYSGKKVGNLRELRNEYGHITAENLEGTHSDEKCIHIRKESRRQLGNIDDIRNILAE